MVFMPPQHGKSELCSKYFPAWYLGLNPDNKIMLASYEADFAASWGRKSRDLLDNHGKELFGVEISKDSSAGNRWEIAGHSGGMFTAGVRGPLTGKNGNILMIDDPVKNDEEADSEAFREAAWDWYMATFSTRMTDDGAMIIIMTRWHEDDLAGKILQQAKDSSKEQWVVVSYPALAESNDPLGRALGEPLCPEIKSHQFLLNAKGRLTNRWWNALYQQHPTADDGEYFLKEWWKRYSKPFSQDDGKAMDFVVQSWDCTFKDTKGSDYVVGTVWGVRGVNAYLMDLVRERMTFTATCDAMEAMTDKWPMTMAKYVEDKANGPAVIDYMLGRIPGLVPVDPRGGKKSRAAASSPFVKSGNVWIPEDNLFPWVEDYVAELAAFPTGANDDQVDSTTQALIQIGPLMQEKPVEQPKTDEEQWQDTMKMVEKEYGRPSLVPENNSFWM